MIRPATGGDLTAILAIRDRAGTEPLSDPQVLNDARASRLIEAETVWVWQVPGEPVAGVAAIDTETGEIAALLVAPGEQGRGIGRALLAAACAALRAAGQSTATVTLEPGNPAERHYRAAGWTVATENDRGQPVFRKPLP